MKDHKRERWFVWHGILFELKYREADQKRHKRGGDTAGEEIPHECVRTWRQPRGGKRDAYPVPRSRPDVCQPSPMPGWKARDSCPDDDRYKLIMIFIFYICCL